MAKRKTSRLDALWVVKGINRMTRQLDQCSMAAPKDVAQLLMDSWKRQPPRKRVYIYLRLVPFINDIFNK